MVSKTDIEMKSLSYHLKIDIENHKLSYCLENYFEHLDNSRHKCIVQCLKIRRPCFAINKLSTELYPGPNPKLNIVRCHSCYYILIYYNVYIICYESHIISQLIFSALKFLYR